MTEAASSQRPLSGNSTLAQINAFLAGNSGASLSYLIGTDAPPASDTLTLRVDDLGYSGGASCSCSSTSGKSA